MSRHRISSMTGYADLEREIGGERYYFSARSVNHRTLDASVRFPLRFAGISHRADRLAKERLARGRVSVLAERATPASGIDVSQETVDAARDAITRIRAAGLALRDPSLGELSQLQERASSARASESEAEEFMGAISDLIGSLAESRADEGEHLRKFLAGAHAEALTALEAFAKDASAIREDVVESVYRRFGVSQADNSDASVSAEVAVACARTDVTEELDRLKAHMQEFGRSLEEGGVVGRKLDFILQEMRRESGTLTSKSSQPEMTHRAIEISLLVERMREQAQNVE